MSIVITCGNVRCELPVADLFVTLPSGYKGNLKIKQEEENVITLDCDSIITIKEENDIMIEESIVPPVITAVPLPQPLRIRTPPLPPSPVTAYDLSPSPIPFACPNSPHDVPELFELASPVSELFEMAPELAPPSLVETAPVNQKRKSKEKKVNHPKENKVTRQKKDNDITKYVEEGEEITHQVSLDGNGTFAYCTSSYKMKKNDLSGVSYPVYTIHSCHPAPQGLVGSSGYTSLTDICRTFATHLEHDKFRVEGLSSWSNGWTISSVMRNGKLVKLSKLRDMAEKATAQNA
jgi:hypothetical protein